MVYKVRCDVCGKMKPEREMVIEYDEHGNLIRICSDCLKEMLGIKVGG